MCLISSIEGFTEDSGEQRFCLICLLGYIKNAIETSDGLRVVTASKKILNFGTPKGSVLKKDKLPILLTERCLNHLYLFVSVFKGEKPRLCAS